VQGYYLRANRQVDRLAQAYDVVMSREQHDREIARYQRELAHATRQLQAAMRAWIAAGPPMSTDSSSPPPDWTAEHRALTQAAANAWREVVLKRGMYEGLIQERDHLYPDPKMATGRPA
jgi:hypothetical protein